MSFLLWYQFFSTLLPSLSGSPLMPDLLNVPCEENCCLVCLWVVLVIVAFKLEVVPFLIPHQWIRCITNDYLCIIPFDNHISWITSSNLQTRYVLLQEVFINTSLVHLVRQYKCWCKYLKIVFVLFTHFVVVSLHDWKRMQIWNSDIPRQKLAVGCIAKLLHILSFNYVLCASSVKDLLYVLTFHNLF